MAALSGASRNRTPRWSLFWVSNKTTKQETGINTVYSQKPKSWLKRKKKQTKKSNTRCSQYASVTLHKCYKMNWRSLLYTVLKKNTWHALTGTCDGLVDRADVDPRGRGFSVGFWDQPDDGHFRVELLGPGLNQLSSLAIPARSLQEQTVDVAAHIRLLRQLCHCLDTHLRENNTKMEQSRILNVAGHLRVIDQLKVLCRWKKKA